MRCKNHRRYRYATAEELAWLQSDERRSLRSCRRTEARIHAEAFDEKWPSRLDYGVAAAVRENPTMPTSYVLTALRVNKCAPFGRPGWDPEKVESDFFDEGGFGYAELLDRVYLGMKY